MPTASRSSGAAVEDDGKGPVEPGAHFYRSYQLDGEGNPINKRNAWQTRSVLYVRLIPPGAADVAHFRVKIPKDAKGPITLHAKLNYRKFSHYYTQFAYAGEPEAGSGRRRWSARVTTAASTRSIRRTFRRTSRGRSRTRFRICRSSRWPKRQPKLEAGDGKTPTEWKPVVAEAGSRALERLGHRPAAARRSERRRVCVHAGHRSRAGVCRRLAERGARADPGRRDRCGEAVHREGARRSMPSSAASISSRRWSQKADGDYDGALAVAANRRRRSIRATAWC